jgi:hypothetical protein
VVSNLGDVQGKYVLRSYDHPTTAILSTQFSCEGGTSPIMLTVGGETTVSTSTTANVDVGVELEGINIGGGLSTESSSSTTQSKSTMVSIPPGRQSVMTMSVLSHSQSGNVQVNFGDRVDDHFIVCVVLILNLQTDSEMPVAFSGSPTLSSRK